MNFENFKDIKINDLAVIQLNIGDNIIWKKEEPTEKLYVGTCLGNYVDTDVVGDDISKVVAEIYYPEEYYSTPQKSVVYFGSRNSSSNTQELSLKVTDTSDLGIYDYHTNDNQMFYARSHSFTNEVEVVINNQDTKVYDVDGNEVNLFRTSGAGIGSNQIPLVLFDIANATTKTSQKKSNVAYIHSVKIYDINDELIRDYESRIINNIPVIVNKLDNTIAPIIGDNLIYYFTDYNDVHIYDPKQPTEISNNEIWYTTSNGLTAQTTNSTGLASLETMGLISNTYVDGKGIMKFSKDVTSIGDRAFQGCTSLTSVILPISTTYLGMSEFYHCDNLANVTLGNNIIGFDSFAFYFCSNLTDINYNGTKAQFSSITKGNNWKYDVPTTCIVHCTDGDYPITDFD